MFDIDMYDLSDIEIHQKRLPIVIGEPEWCLMAQKVINSLTTMIMSILFSIAWWETIKMSSYSPPKFAIAMATAKCTPCIHGSKRHTRGGAVVTVVRQTIVYKGTVHVDPELWMAQNTQMDFVHHSECMSV